MYTGDCNSCGKCCQAQVHHPDLGIIEFQCENLMVFDRTGRPGATACSVYDKRWLGMPIVMQMVGNSNVRYQSKCLMTYPRSSDAIPPECSYGWNSNEPQPGWNLTYTPYLAHNLTEK